MSDILARRVVELLESFGPDILPELEPLYHPDVIFTDPLQTLTGRDAFMAMNRKLIARARVCRFDVETWAVRGNDVFLAWLMTYAPRRGPELGFEGTSLLTVRDGLVVLHRDYWDLAGNLLDAVPGVGPLYRKLVARLV